jgi:hypothetical protein
MGGKVTVSCMREPLFNIFKLSRKTKCLTLAKVGKIKVQATESDVLSSERRKGKIKQ